MAKRSVALLIETSNAYSRGLLEGVIDYTKQRGDWFVQLTEQQRGAEPPHWLATWNGDGIIARIETHAIADRLKEFRIPVVDLSAARQVRGIPWADTDDAAISRLAFDHFVDRGFRHLGYVGDPGFAWSQKRCERLREFADRAGVDFLVHNSKPRYAPDFHPVSATRNIGQWLQSVPKPIGVMACYDFKAQEVLDACRQSNLKVPEQVAVLGVDDDRLICELSQPKLSSIVPNTHRTGYEAAELLERMMSGELVSVESPLITTPLGITVRESTDTLALDDEQVSIALHYIRRHSNANLRVTDVLKQISLSRRSLEHRFKKLVGRTPHEEIQRVRMNRVKALLCDTELSIQEIAELVGFEYGEYLAAAFRREVGVSPSEYRNKHA